VEAEVRRRRAADHLIPQRPERFRKIVLGAARGKRGTQRAQRLAEFVHEAARNPGVENDLLDRADDARSAVLRDGRPGRRDKIGRRGRRRDRGRAADDGRPRQFDHPGVVRLRIQVTLRGPGILRAPCQAQQPPALRNVLQQRAQPDGDLDEVRDGQDLGRAAALLESQQPPRQQPPEKVVIGQAFFAHRRGACSGCGGSEDAWLVPDVRRWYGAD
jgi:hypothetical protein